MQALLLCARLWSANAHATETGLTHHLAPVATFACRAHPSHLHSRPETGEHALQGIGGRAHLDSAIWCARFGLQEIGALSTSLPLDFESSIVVAVDETHLDMLR